MKRFVIISLITAVLMGPPVFVKAYAAPAVTPQAEVKLNDSQKNELKALYEQKMEIQKKLLQKYVEFGVIPKERADMKLKRMDEMEEALEKNGYMPIHKKDFKHHNGGKLKRDQE